MVMLDPRPFQRSEQQQIEVSQCSRPARHAVNRQALAVLNSPSMLSAISQVGRRNPKTIRSTRSRLSRQAILPLSCVIAVLNGRAAAQILPGVTTTSCNRQSCYQAHSVRLIAPVQAGPWNIRAAAKQRHRAPANIMPLLDRYITDLGLPHMTSVKEVKQVQWQQSL